MIIHLASPPRNDSSAHVLAAEDNGLTVCGVTVYADWRRFTAEMDPTHTFPPIDHHVCSNCMYTERWRRMRNAAQRQEVEARQLAERAAETLDQGEAVRLLNAVLNVANTYQFEQLQREIQKALNPHPDLRVTLTIEMHGLNEAPKRLATFDALENEVRTYLMDALQTAHNRNSLCWFPTSELDNHIDIVSVEMERPE